MRGLTLTDTIKRKVMGLDNSSKMDQRKFTLDQFLPEGEIRPDDIRMVLQQFPISLIIILDEVDRIDDMKVRQLLADTIKAFSDHSLLTTLILVGVADTVSNLIGDHASIERALVQIQVPRMDHNELSQLLDLCLNQLNIEITDEARNSILVLSKGLPHYAHLLGMHATEQALSHERKSIIHTDIEYAVDKAILESTQTLRHSYFSATPRTRNSLYPDVLLACALSDTNPLGFFDATEIKLQLSDLKGKNYEVRAFTKHLTAFSSEKYKILERVGDARSYQYRFINPLMQPFILMKGIQDEKVSYKKLRRSYGFSD